MGALTAPEIRDVRDWTPLQRATNRHAEVLQICEHLVQAMHAWGRLGKLCTLVERDKDWELLGYSSFGAWMMAVEEHSGYSRASAYAYMKLFQQLEKHDIEGMSLGTAQVFKLLPAALQRSPEVRSAAKRMKPKQFREKIATEYPDSHIETQEEVCLKLDEGVLKMWRETIDDVRILEDDPAMSHEAVLEHVLAWVLEQLRPAVEKKQQ
jgi:hypothetical protein